MWMINLVKTSLKNNSKVRRKTNMYDTFVLLFRTKLAKSPILISRNPLRHKL